MTWWIWILAGLALLAVEVVVPGGIIMLFFGAAAIVLGILVAVGLGGPVWFQWLLFSFLSIASLLTLRGPIVKRLERRRAGPEGVEVDSFVGQTLVLERDLKPGIVGKAELRGTSWSVESTGEPLKRGQRCVVTAVEGLKLRIRAE